MLVHQSAHRVTHMDLIRKNYETLLGAEPLNLFILKGIPRKETVIIGKHKSLHTQVTTYGHHAIGVIKYRQLRMRKSQYIIIKFKNHSYKC